VWVCDSFNSQGKYRAETRHNIYENVTSWNFISISYVPSIYGLQLWHLHVSDMSVRNEKMTEITETR
jgi:hypothetical protein